MAKHPTLLQHFRSFAYQNSIDDLDTALAYFAVFGGTGWDIDTSKSVEILIEEKVLRNYESLHHSMTRYTHNNPVYHRLLSIIALGAEYEHDAFKKAKIGKERGEEAIDYLENKSLLRFDLSVKEPIKESDGKSDRILFALPFMRFWFGFVSQNYKNIAEGNFDEFREKWQQSKANFPILLSNLLIRELVKQKAVDDPVVSIGSYYDRHTHIEILAIRKSGKMLAGACKYAKEPAKPHMLHALKEKCQKAELDITEYVLFSKNGFSPEMEEIRDAEMTCLSYKDLSSLLDDLSEADLLVYTNRKY
ncbi:DUF234 domain-containing protein [Sulfurovum sp. NBC37-1]|uniref:DUF234 domain-containing protein n=1 Tax=Sulfurovum sp. (strain NBC37-1) TaxID=387093 RepID=UPI00015878B2|nr:DUF234 domain-containing protein [Sulfurovum sp. NBC37-1]BAF71705.1 conserved hypothetical protein [Sulfurovum sp. NBC37-1]